MRIYLDMCCFKRPFDDHRQSRVRLESEAVMALIEASGAQLELIRSPALDLENSVNPLPSRAARVREWLESLPLAVDPEAPIEERVAELMSLGFRNLDAFHLASAEVVQADAFATCDDRLQRTAKRHESTLKTRVVNPVELVREVSS
jgi:hypothetical protein